VFVIDAPTLKRGLPLVRRSNEPRVSSPTDSLPRFDHFEAVTAKEFAKRPPPIWAVAGLIPLGICEWIGKSQARKSFLALALGASVASGTPFLGQKVEQGRVLYVALEDSFELQLRIKAILTELGPDVDRFIISESGVTLPHSREAFNDLNKFLAAMLTAKRPITMIIFDTYAYLNDGEENDASNTTEILRYLRQIAVQFDLSIILIHHPSGEDESRGRGSTALFNGIASVLLIRDEGNLRSSIQVKKNKGAPIGQRYVAQFVVEQLGDGATTLKLGKHAPTISAVTTPLDPKREPYVEVLRRAGSVGLSHGMWAEEMKKTHGVSLSTFNKQLPSLKSDPRVKHDGKAYVAVPVPDQFQNSAGTSSAEISASAGGLKTPASAPASAEEGETET
jgi:hypothetical protein